MKPATPRIVKRLSVARLADLAEQLVVAKDAKQVASLKKRILNGYYGRRIRV